MDPKQAVAAESGASTISVGPGGLVVAIAAVSALAFAVFRELYKSLKPQQPAADEGKTEAESKMTSNVTESELRAATGEDGRALFIAVKDPFSDNITVFDVSTGSDFYGPGGPYHVFAGKDATHGLATSSTDPAKTTGDLSDLTASEKDTHIQWYTKYSSKYPIIGNLVPDGTTDGGDDDVTSTVTTESKKDA